MNAFHGTQNPVTVLGLGLMGRALAAALLRAGTPTTVWNRSPEKAAELTGLGARLAGSVGEAVAASPLVIVCVTDYPAVRGLLEPLGDALAGRVVVNLTSGTSQQAREMGAWAAGRGFTYLDGAILAVPQDIGTEAAVVIYSGPLDAFDAHAATLRHLAAATTHLGADPGLASLYDAAMLGFMWSVLNGFLHATALLGTAKVDAVAVAPFLTQGFGVMATWLSDYAAQIDAADYPAHDSTVATHLAAMDHLLHESASLGVNTELPALIRRLAARAADAGHAGHSYAALIAQFRTPA
ncbi:NAD(P)-binding domain-containing protein [Actinocorallia lasiicapitis]